MDEGGRAKRVKNTIDNAAEFSVLREPHIFGRGISGPVSLMIGIYEEIKYFIIL
jgi:hypothetical protein